MVRVGTAYGAFGSDASIVTRALVANKVSKLINIDITQKLGSILSDIEDVKGTDPVNRTTSRPKVRSAIPSDLEKYSSRTMLRLANKPRRVE